MSARVLHLAQPPGARVEIAGAALEHGDYLVQLATAVPAPCQWVAYAHIDGSFLDYVSVCTTHGGVSAEGLTPASGDCDVAMERRIAHRRAAQALCEGFQLVGPVGHCTAPFVNPSLPPSEVVHGQ